MRYKNKLKALHQRGLTLIEAAMVLAIATLVVAGIMMFFQSANMNSKTNEAVGQLGAVQQAVRSVYAGQPTYAGLNAQALADTRSLPTKMVVGSGAGVTLRHAFNGTINVAPITIAGGSPNNGFSIQFVGIPSEACTKLATMDLGTGMFNMDVTGGSASNGNTRAMTPTAAAAACGNSNSASILWRFF